MIYKIKPLIGIGDAKFGMSAAEIGAIWGPPNSVRKKKEGKIDEERTDSIVHYEDSGVVEFTFFPEVDLFLGEVNLFKSSDPISVLMGYDSSPKESLGFVVFLKIGVAISGYHDVEDDDEDERSITTFRSEERLSEIADCFKEFLWPQA